MAIDPISGLPVDLGLPDFYNVPMISTPTDLTSWGAQRNPPSSQFPDDVLSTLSTIQAKRRSSIYMPQQLESTDNGALYVALDQSGGASSSGVGGSQGLMVSSDIVNAGANDPGASVPPDRNILGVNFWVYVRPDRGAGLIEGIVSVSLFFGFSSSDPGTQPIAALYVSTDPGVSGCPRMFTTGYMPLGAGLNLKTLGAGDPNYYVGFANSTVAPLAMGIFMQYELV